MRTLAGDRGRVLQLVGANRIGPELRGTLQTAYPPHRTCQRHAPRQATRASCAAEHSSRILSRQARASECPHKPNAASLQRAGFSVAPAGRLREMSRSPRHAVQDVSAAIRVGDHLRGPRGKACDNPLAKLRSQRLPFIVPKSSPAPDDALCSGGGVWFHRGSCRWVLQPPPQVPRS